MSYRVLVKLLICTLTQIHLGLHVFATVLGALAVLLRCVWGWVFGCFTAATVSVNVFSETQATREGACRSHEAEWWVRPLIKQHHCSAAIPFSIFVSLLAESWSKPLVSNLVRGSLKLNLSHVVYWLCCLFAHQRGNLKAFILRSMWLPPIRRVSPAAGARIVQVEAHRH